MSDTARSYVLPDFNPADWFWRGTPGLYSSATHALVADDDAAFVSWKARTGLPDAQIWPCDDAGEQTQAALDGVLVALGVTAAPAPAITYKADIYRRATDDEAEAIEGALSQAPVRQRRLFEAAQYLDHAAPEFALMHDALVTLFGEARADALLAPSQA